MTDEKQSEAEITVSVEQPAVASTPEATSAKEEKPTLIVTLPVEGRSWEETMKVIMKNYRGAWKRLAKR